MRAGDGLSSGLVKIVVDLTKVRMNRKHDLDTDENMIGEWVEDNSKITSRHRVCCSYSNIGGHEKSRITLRKSYSFKLYITFLSLGHSRSATTVRLATIRFGVPEGSVVGPNLYVMYAIIRKHGFSAHSYIDYLQLYTTMVIRLTVQRSCRVCWPAWSRNGWHLVDRGSTRQRLNSFDVEKVSCRSAADWRLYHQSVGYS